MELTVQELKLTAALYAKRGAADYVKQTGKLPKTINNGGMHIGMRLLIAERGRDITLTPDEQVVYDAIVREKRLPGGAVHLVPEQPEKPSKDS